MDTNSIWSLLSSIPVGTIVAWGIVITTIITAICTGTIKLYKMFTKYTKMREENEEQKKIIKKHEETLEAIEKSLQSIQTTLNEQKDVNLKQIRYLLVHACDGALSDGKITIEALRSMEDMYSDYITIFDGNGYVKTLMMKVRSLPVEGNPDDL